MPTSSHPAVSVVIAVRDGVPYIGRTIISALAQSLQDIEVIVIDDGSTDDTGSVVQALARRDPRVRLVSLPPSGVSVARNRGVAEARSDMVAVLDGDDLWHPDKLMLQATMMAAGDGKIAAVGSLAVTIDVDDHLLVGRLPFSYRTLRALNGPALLPFMCSPSPWCGSMPLFSKRRIEEVGGYDTAMPVSEDYELAAKLAERHPFAVVPRFLVGYRQTPGTRSTDARANMSAEFDLVREVAARNPWIPRRVLRWVRARRFVFASARSMHRGDLFAAMRHGARAAICDPASLVRPDGIGAAVALARRTPPPASKDQLRFPDDLDEFLSLAPVDVFPGSRAFDLIDWRRYLAMVAIESRHHGGHGGEAELRSAGIAE